MAKQHKYLATVHRTVEVYQTRTFEVQARSVHEAAQQAIALAEEEDDCDWEANSTDQEVQPQSIYCDDDDVEKLED